MELGRPIDCEGLLNQLNHSSLFPLLNLLLVLLHLTSMYRLPQQVHYVSAELR